ncbi:MAG: hypothetical protein GF353_06540 [Candidatus Lokiarchaeota archaeon]|nr:hypothetical protein [Candidatus Lokiarchaeota archaeon]
MYYLPTTIILIGFSIFTLIYTLKNWKQKKSEHLLANEIIVAILFFVAGISYPWMIPNQSSDISESGLKLIWVVTSLILSLEMIVWFSMLVYNIIICHLDKNQRLQRDYSEFCEKFNQNWVYDFKSDVGRKGLHLFTVGIIFMFWFLGQLFESLGLLECLGLDANSFAYWWITTIGLGFIIMFQLADLARLNAFFTLPKWAKNWYEKSMRKEETNTFVASTLMVLAFVPFIFVPFPIFATVALITTGADAAASLVGKKMGKHKLPTNSQKTLEGLIAGAMATFLIVMGIFLIFSDYLNIDLTRIFIIASAATTLFALIDSFSKHINDNLLNPLIIGFTMWILYIV